ncbi:MAG: S-ribosylhomocysteine lyase [Erysipelotrichaceae bacterium]|nr:S-ribosylhomocysteine lyase [Erysipelotrichaceae bacterium]
MERITSFSVDHEKLAQGIYVSRVDGDIVTYDLRMTVPNLEAAIDPKGAHAIEHLGATILRNGQFKDKIIYFGPMGCMTGFYLIVKDQPIEKVADLVKDVCEKIVAWDGPIPGASAKECGNYTYMDLAKAKAAVRHYLDSQWEFEYHYL